MKKLYLIISCTLFFIVELAAQITGLFTYEGGYFVKDGNNWAEYRPQSKDGVWASYMKYDEDENYYYINNSKCSLCVPKKKHNKFYISKNGEWEVIYYTKEIYSYFKANGRQIYCYEGGYFVKDGNNWAEYRPQSEDGVWASYMKYDEDENYYYINNSKCSLCVPKKKHNKFYISRNNEWEVIYNTTDIYDVASEYDYMLYFKYYKVADAEGKLQEVNEPASISLSRKGKMRLCCGSKSYDGKFSELAVTTLRNSDTELGFKLIVDENNYIQFIGDWCMVNVESICPFMDFMDCTNKDLIEIIKNKIKDKSFFVD